MPRRIGVSKPIPAVQKYMTPAPRTIGPDQPLAVAHRMMREHHFRHLPVLAGRKLVGMLTERDLHLIETLRDVDPEKVTVEEAMSQQPFTVEPDAPLDEVAGAMGEHKLRIRGRRPEPPGPRRLHHRRCVPRALRAPPRSPREIASPCSRRRAAATTMRGGCRRGS